MNIPKQPEFTSSQFFFLEDIFAVENIKYIVIGYLKENPSKKIVAKIFNITDQRQMNEAKNEENLLKKLKDYRHAVKYISSEKYSKGQLNFYAIYLNFYPKGNMQGLFRQLIIHNKVLPQEIIRKMLFSLVEMLQNLQLEGICHRDIKLENIFIDENNDIFLGDFGDGKSDIVDLNSIHTLRGTLNYLSPILAYKYEQLIAGGEFKAEHNPYKSDVFSLGLVVLNILTKKEIIYSKSAYLEMIRVNHMNLERSVLKWVTSKMLQIEENKRPDFIELYQILLKIENLNLCFECFEEIRESKPTCIDCLASFHSKCLKSRYNCNICNCSVYCNCCGNNYIFYLKDCRAKYCLNCHIQNCSNELLQILDFPIPFTKQKNTLRCCFCDWVLVKEENVYKCLNCIRKMCTRCLRPHFKNNDCLEVFNYLNIRCSCNSVLEYTEGLFTNCRNCGMICKICLKKDTEDSHLECVSGFNLEC